MSSEKTEQPTEKRLRDARNKGQVVKSQEITALAQLAALLMFFSFQVEELLKAISSLIEVTLESVNLPLTEGVSKLLTVVKSLFIKFLGSIALLLIIVTVLSIFFQIGFLISSESIGLKGSKLNPIENFKQMFSVKNLFQLIKSIIKIIILGTIFYYLLKQYVNTFQFLSVCGIHCALPVLSKLIFWLWGSLVAAYIIFSLVDYSFQRREIMKQLMMSKEDIKQEYKTSEGSPEIKSRRRQLHQEIQSGSMSANIKKSSVIIRNPNHIAVCLYYVQGETPLPKILEKGVDAKAEMILSIAENAGIPIVRNIPLARALHQEVAVDQYIPRHLFEPVAEVLRIIMNIEYQREEE